MPREAWQPFKDRLETAEDALNEAARLTPRDVCVFSSLVSIGKALGWERKKMERTIERGLQVSKKDFFLIDAMATNLLPRRGGAPGDLGKFAARMSERIQGEDGIYVYARIARLTQVAEVSLMRDFGDRAVFAESNRDFTDPNVVLEEFSADKLRAAIAVLHKRHPKAKRSMNYVCWLCCVLDDRETAKERFAEILDKPDLAVWGSRDGFDRWRHWADPSIAEPSQFLPIDGKEIAHLQAYSDGAAKIEFLRDNQTLITGSPAPAAAIKFWDLEQKKIPRQFEPSDAQANLIDFWLLDTGQLLVPMFDGKKPFLIEYSPPDYARNSARPASLFGMPFYIVSDDGHIAASCSKTRS